MEIDIIIDGFPECLEDTTTGEIVKTYYKICDYKIPEEKNDWKFDWNKQQIESTAPIYELYTIHDNNLQGRISFYDKNDHVYVELVETAPHNFGHNGKYMGVGAHLFAIACKYSFLYGYEGNVAFLSKTKLIEHYIQTLGAVMLTSQVLGIKTDKAKFLVQRFFPEEVRNGKIY